MSAHLHEQSFVHRSGHLEVRVDLTPIGGYCRVGALIINHVEHKVFTDWNSEELKTLSELIETILLIREKAGIENSLILGRQDQTEYFKLTLIPYPKCNWIEKIQGFFHFIFGSPSLYPHQIKKIAEFYRIKFKGLASDIKPEERKSEKLKCSTSQDAFCRDSVIQKQRIIDVVLENRTYHILHDYRSRGNAQDAHLLIIPKGPEGHFDGSSVPYHTRFELLSIVQKTMQIFLSLKFSTLLYLERHGKNLRSVPHQHSHVLGILNFPNHFLTKLKTLIQQLNPFVLSQQALQQRIQNYQSLFQQKDFKNHS